MKYFEGGHTTGYNTDQGSGGREKKCSQRARGSITEEWAMVRESQGSQPDLNNYMMYLWPAVYIYAPLGRRKGRWTVENSLPDPGERHQASSCIAMENCSFCRQIGRINSDFQKMHHVCYQKGKEKQLINKASRGMETTIHAHLAFKPSTILGRCPNCIRRSIGIRRTFE